MVARISVLDHGYVQLRNVAGPTRRIDQEFDAHDRDPANTARISFDQADNKNRLVEDDYKLAEFLISHQHTTPIEMIVTWWEMKMPIFIARQFVRHRTVTINEMSARYIKLPDQFYIPDPRVIGHKGATQKQGRIIDGKASAETIKFSEQLSKHCKSAYALYEEAISDGVPHELARSVLPLNVYTKWVWKQDLHNLMHFMSLRSGKHAQYEIRAYSDAMELVMESVLPKTMELYRKYRKKEE